MKHIANEKAPEKKNEEEDEPEEAVEASEGKDQYAELKESMLRLAAEFDNYKKRVKKELDSAERNGKMVLIKDLLPIVDEFELAMLAIGNADDNVGKGIEMLYSNLMDKLKKEGLKEIDAKGVFDPYKHEIVMVRESDKKEGTILEVVKKGYLFDDRLLRPSSVIIAKGKAKKDDEKSE